MKDARINDNFHSGQDLVCVGATIKVRNIQSSPPHPKSSLQPRPSETCIHSFHTKSITLLKMLLCFPFWNVRARVLFPPPPPPPPPIPIPPPLQDGVSCIGYDNGSSANIFAVTITASSTAAVPATVSYRFMSGDCATAGSATAKCTGPQTPGPWPCHIEHVAIAAGAAVVPPEAVATSSSSSPSSSSSSSSSAAPTVATAADTVDNVTCVVQHNIDHKFNDLHQVGQQNTAQCCALCKAEPKCKVWVLTPDKTCWLKHAYGTPGTQIVEADGTVSMCTKAGAAACPDYKGDCMGYTSQSDCTFNSWQQCQWQGNACRSPPAPPRKTFVCNGEQQCVPGMGRVNYNDPSCLGLCNGTAVAAVAAPIATQHGHAMHSGVEVDVEEFGATADGKTECGAAFTAALRNVSSRGGGIVHARSKGTYVVNPIQLQNHTVLQIAAGTFINASTHCPSPSFPTLMLLRPPQCGGTENTSSFASCGTVFFAGNAHNFTINGGGSVDGGGVAFDLPPYTHPRGSLLQFWMSSHAIVEDLKFYNSASVHIVPAYCQHMQFRRLYMYSDFAGAHHKNTDGFDPFASSDISLTDSYIHNGDDCIAVKSGKQPAAWSCDVPCENILIKNVTCAGSHGLTIGSEVAGGIRNVTFSNVRIHGADGYPSAGAIKIKLPCGRGAYVKDVLYEDITAFDVATAISMSRYGADASCSINGTTVVSNVTIRNVHAQKIAGPAFGIDGYSVVGRPANYTSISVRLENVTVVDYAQLGTCSHAIVQASDVSPAIPTKDASCVVSK